MPQARKKKRLILLATALLSAALVAYLILTALRFMSTYGQLVEAKDLLLAVDSSLREEGLDSSPATLAEAESQAMRAGDKFRSAQAFLGGEPLLQALGWLPGLGPQVSAARELASIGYEASDIGVTAVSVIRTFKAAGADGKGALGERLVTFLQAIEPEMTMAEETLATIRQRRNNIDGRWIVAPLSSLISQLDVRLTRVEAVLKRYRQVNAAAPPFLGFAGPRRYLVLGLDNTELMPGGGLIGTYGVITFAEGQVVDRFFDEVETVIDRWQEGSGGEYIEPPGPLKRYLLRHWTWNFGVANWSPDFPTAARQALFFYRRSGAEAVDGVIAIDFAGLEGLLAVLGPTEVPGYGVTVDSENVTEAILTRIGKPLHPGEGDHAFANAVAAAVLDRAFAVGEEKLSSLLQTLDRLALEKHLFLYASDHRLESSLREVGWAGEVRDTAGDYLMAVNASVHSTKLNLVLDEHMEVSIQLEADGSARHTVTLTYENRLAEWAKGRDPQTVHNLMISGFYGGYLRLLVPPQAQLLDLQLNGKTAGVEEITQEVGKASFGRYFPLPRDTRAVLRFLYRVPDAVDNSRGSYEYRLLIQKQAGVRAPPLRLAISLPPRAKVVSVSLDSQRLDDNPLKIETDLSQDRELVVRYEP